MKADTLAQRISPARRAFNYLGKSAWASDEHFQGKMDEPVLSRTARGADWIKLSYANQKPGQNLVSFKKAVGCAARFEVPKDTVMDEGQLLKLAGMADCASGYSWSVVSGPAPRILDPEVKVLQIRIPRVNGSISLVYCFSAQFEDSIRTREIKVDLREAVPDPVFTLPPSISWGGRDSLLIRPAIANLAASRATRDTVFRFAWSLDGAALDSAWRADGLLLTRSLEEGKATVGLCLDNGGAVTCHDMEVVMGSPTSSENLALAARMTNPGNPWNAAGRRLGPGTGRSRGGSMPTFARPDRSLPR